jgi:chromosomal replication initiator protein
MYLSKELTRTSLPEIGKKFGGKHHTTVLHSIRKIDKLKEADSDFNKKLNRIIEYIR